MADIQPHRFATPRAGQVTSVGGAAVGIMVSLLGDWTAFWLGAAIMAGAAMIVVALHRQEIWALLTKGTWNSHLTLPLATLAVMAAMAAYSEHRVSHPMPDRLSAMMDYLRTHTVGPSPSAPILSAPVQQQIKGSGAIPKTPVPRATAVSSVPKPRAETPTSASIQPPQAPLREPTALEAFRSIGGHAGIRQTELRLAGAMVPYNMYSDAESGANYGAFFVDSREDTVGIAEDIIQHSVFIIDSMSHGGSEISTSNETNNDRGRYARFTGRVYIYVEARPNVEKEADLVKRGREKGLIITFRNYSELAFEFQQENPEFVRKLMEQQQAAKAATVPKN